MNEIVPTEPVHPPAVRGVSLRRPALRWAGQLLDWILPHRCPGCGVAVSAAGTLCAGCWPTLRFIAPPLCACCGVPFDLPAPPDTLCGACLAEPPAFVQARAAFLYEGAVQQAIVGFKHADRADHLRFLAQALVRAGAEQLRDPQVVLVPVPLHRGRLFRRGFNQATVLAEAVGRLCHRPVLAHALVRTRPTPSQQGLDRAHRLRNLARAFDVRSGLRARLLGRRVVLVDDVMTTGATVTACTLALKAAGVQEVRVLTVARVAGHRVRTI